MTVVYGVDFDGLPAGLADSLRGLDDARVTVVPVGGGLAFDALLVPVGDTVDGAVEAAKPIAADADIVAIGAAPLEEAALDAGAMEFVEWPGDHSVAAQLGLIARRLRRVRQQRLDMERLRRLDAIRLKFLASNADLDTLLKMICDELLASEDLRAMTGADGAVVEMIEGDEIVYRAASGIMEAVAGYRIPLDGSLTNATAKAGEVLWSPDTEEDPRVNIQACRAAGVRSTVAAPLECDGKVVGVLKLVASKPGGFDALDRRIVRGMSEMASAAMQREMERARLRGDLAYHSAALQALERDHEALRTLATTDPLTGLLNRRQFAQSADEALHKGIGRRPGMAVLVMDLDDFKGINDRHGHAAGDAVLVAVAGWLQGAVREGDVIGRLGGEEFGIVLARIERDAAISTAERIRQMIADGVVSFDGAPLSVTASIGVAILDRPCSRDEALRRADAALYRAKADGRNRIAIEDEDNVLKFPGARA